MTKVPGAIPDKTELVSSFSKKKMRKPAIDSPAVLLRNRDFYSPKVRLDACYSIFKVHFLKVRKKPLSSGLQHAKSARYRGRLCKLNVTTIRYKGV